MTGSELHAQLYRHFPSLIADACHVQDADYRVPATKRDFVKSLNKEWRKFKALNSVGPYKLEKNDCDDFALHALSCARLWLSHAKPFGEYAMPFGMMEYKDDDQGWHAINLFICGRNKTIYYWEPQKSMEITLSESEVKSVRAITI